MVVIAMTVHILPFANALTVFVIHKTKIGHGKTRFNTINDRGRQDELLFYRDINYSTMSTSVDGSSLSRFNTNKHIWF